MRDEGLQSLKMTIATQVFIMINDHIIYIMPTSRMILTRSYLDIFSEIFLIII